MLALTTSARQFGRDNVGQAKERNRATCLPPLLFPLFFPRINLGSFPVLTIGAHLSARGKMSKLAEKLKLVHRGPTSTLGFRRSTEAEVSPLLIIANLTKASLTEVKGMVASGIDAGIVGGKVLDAKSLGQLTKAVDGAPLGFILETGGRPEIGESIDVAYDFVVFDLKAPFAVLDKKNLGKVLKIEPTLDPGLARAINRLPLTVDGVMVAGNEDNSVTIERLLVYQRFAELLDRPILATVSSPLTGGELMGLCEAGVSGLLLAESFTRESIIEIKKSIGSISRSARPRARAAALLPRLTAEPEVEVEEVEEEDI
jgi:hypothetical protein